MNELHYSVASKRFQAIRAILFLIGGSTVLALIPLCFPLSLLRFLHIGLGLGEPPSQAVFEYMARSLCVMYAAHGLLVLSVAIHPAKYWPLIQVIAMINMLIGGCLIMIDWNADMPTWWLVMEGPPIIAIGSLLFWLHSSIPAPVPDKSPMTASAMSDSNSAN